MSYNLRYRYIASLLRSRIKKTSPGICELIWRSLEGAWCDGNTPVMFGMLRDSDVLPPPTVGVSACKVLMKHRLCSEKTSRIKFTFLRCPKSQVCKYMQMYTFFLKSHASKTADHSRIQLKQFLRASWKAPWNLRCWCKYLSCQKTTVSQGSVACEVFKPLSCGRLRIVTLWHMQLKKNEVTAFQILANWKLGTIAETNGKVRTVVHFWWPSQPQAACVGIDCR